MNRMAELVARIAVCPYIRQRKIESQTTERARMRRYVVGRRRRDPMFCVIAAMRNRMRDAIAVRGGKKAHHTNTLLGCSRPDFRKHIESQFTEGMAWENYGTWEIDHIKPCAAFDLTETDEQLACFHYSNLQPLWKKDNAKKGAFYVSALV